MEASSLFSGIQRPYNTVTSADQQDAATTGNDQGPSDQTPDQSPVANIMAAMMRAGARVQGQEQAKKVFKDQATGNDGVKLAFTGKKTPDGVPFIKFEGPVDVINGTQQKDLIAAHDTPGQQVEQKLNPQSEAADNAPAQAPVTPAPTTPPSPDHPLEKTFSALDESQGYREPRPWDSDIREKLKTPDGIRRLNFEMGGTAQDAAVKIRQLKNGEVTLDEAAQRVADWRLQHGEEKAQKLEAALAPAERSAKDKIITDNINTDNARQLKTQQDQERKAVYDRWTKIKDTTDWTNIPKDQRRQAFDDQNDTGVQPSEAVYNQIERTADRQVAASLISFRKDKAALGVLPDFATAKESFGHDIPADQVKGFEADWKAARNDYNIKQKNEELKIKAAANQAQRLQITLDRQPDHPSAGAAYDQQLDKLIAAENSGADLTKMGVDTKTHGDMVQRRLVRMASGDQEAQFPVALSVAGATAMSKISGLRTETQGLMGTLDKYLATPEGKKYANVPFSELPAAAKYKMGMASDDEIAKLQSAFSIERYAGTLQLIPGIRRGDIIQKASEHLPIFGKDSIQLMRDKLANADKFYANNQAGLQKYSTKTGVSNNGGATSPSGPVITDPSAILNIFKKKP